MEFDELLGHLNDLADLSAAAEYDRFADLLRVVRAHAEREASLYGARTDDLVRRHALQRLAREAQTGLGLRG
jgi:hypothetical protein